MADEKEVSPTGEPVMSQRMVRVLGMACAVLGALNGALLAVYGVDHIATQLTFIALATAAPLVGMASPGWRRPPR